MFKEITFICGRCNSINKKSVSISEKTETILTIVCETCGANKIMKLNPVKPEIEPGKPLIAKKEKKVRGFGNEGWKNE